MAETSLYTLLDKYLTEELTDEEKLRLQELFNSHEQRPALEQYVDDFIKSLQHDQLLENPVMLKEMHEKVDFIINEKKTVRRVHLLRKWSWAAAIILSLGTGAYLYTNTKKEKPNISQNETRDTEVLPGTDRAILTLSDGRTIPLDSAANGVIARQGNASIIKKANGEVVYDVKGLSQGNVMMNIMTTPRRGQYQFVLPDGSKVWLNAASSVSYPAAFVGNERKIKVTGEAYFEIANDKTKPFLVDVDGQLSVQVLGTSFDVNSYADEGNIKTTLLEGRVKIFSRNTRVVASSSGSQLKSGEASVVLKPGQQAELTNLSSGRQLEVVNADIEQALAWKNGMFNFNGLSVRAVMAQLARWYDIEVRYEGSPSTDVFKGKMYRNEKLSFVLDGLRKMGINCRMEGKTLTVTQ